MYGLIWSAVIAPAAFMPIVYFAGRRIGRNTCWLAFIPLLFSSAFFMTLLFRASELPMSEYFYWLPEIRFGVMVDGLSLPIVFTVALLSAIIVIYSKPYMERTIHEMYHGENNRAHATYYALYLAYATSMMGVVLSTNLFEFYFFFELMIIPSWALINIYGTGKRERVALMYLLWSILGAVLFVTGALTTYATLHSFEISDMFLLQGSPRALFIVATILLGFSIKMAMFGLHAWLPSAYAEAPTSISALISSGMTGLAAYGMVRLLIPIRGILDNSYLAMLSWGLVSIIYGGLMVLAQNDIKKLLAYSSISQMGYLFVGIVSTTTLGVAGSMLHYVSHGLGKAVLFLAVGAVIYRSGHRDIRSLGGLADRMPLSAMAFLIGCMNLSGIPPTLGFVSKLFIFTGAFGHGLEATSKEFIVALIAIISTSLTVAYTFWMVRRIFYGPLPGQLRNIKEAPLLMTVPMMILCLLSILAGIYPGIILNPLLQVVKGLFQT